ncbi:MAG: hypothetical protein COS76_02160 [Candidatus Portnoybacteria bacterium CG06_land_8_20_14_3_00_39_12]|uniref:Uncharacterized protein n=2 Tax=Candidatus Portnoyibacteriota TaxID=1817913 RepID=A0A2M7UKB3_9BACT|nr:MAG: hypothetical protein COS76_02160 [Candidatus Portnoybacteria bacterium CG06_land_8_20_14_3_00_39_12]PIZ71677.1 MAG: hypothetical protein COY09_00205 [Candidatus Portnoybacteria bacterium CG_4_10_14_0_2_um_filter_39_11]
MFQGKKYADCLFFCHLTIEKILKGLVVRYNSVVYLQERFDGVGLGWCLVFDI